MQILKISCKSEHRTHQTESFGDIIPQMENVRAKMDTLKQAIEAYKISVSKIIDRLQKVTQNIEEYYNINDNIIQNYEHNFYPSRSIPSSIIISFFKIKGELIVILIFFFI